MTCYRMDVETEVGNSRISDCPTQQSVAVSLCEEQLQCELHAVKIEDSKDCVDENSDNSVSSSTVTDSQMNCSETLCKANASDTNIQFFTCHVDSNNSLTLFRLKDAELLCCETSVVVKDAENERHCIPFDTAEVGKSTDCRAQHMQLTSTNDESVSVVDCGDDDHKQSQRLLSSEGCECTEASSDTHQLDDVSSSSDLGCCFTISPESQSHSTASLQDAFLQFLKKKQVS